MFRNRRGYVLLIFVILMVCTAFASCGSEPEEDVNCEIGILSEGDDYTAAIELTDRNWEEMTEVQRVNVVDQCIGTVEFSNGDQEAVYELTGIDKATGRQLFRYSSENQKTVFIEEGK